MPKTFQHGWRRGFAGAEIDVGQRAVPLIEGRPRAAKVFVTDTPTSLQQTPVSTSTPFIAGDENTFVAFTKSVKSRSLLYTPEQRKRRDMSVWTLVQGVLAPLQFAAFLISLIFVIRYLETGRGLELANASVVAKTVALYTIMITGCIWERDVFGCFLFARPFFWEDVFSMLVLALHTSYLVALYTGALSPTSLMLLALCAYATYLVNAIQFVLKLRAARLQDRSGALEWGAAS